MCVGVICWKQFQKVLLHVLLHALLFSSCSATVNFVLPLPDCRMRGFAGLRLLGLLVVSGAAVQLPLSADSPPIAPPPQENAPAAVSSQVARIIYTFAPTLIL